ncbi:hypothetical protein GGD83_004292 [Rhodoblastus sphagnicola]|nr:hypothetical protein [Rhodoblastus sphagnicola]MBB4200463.1 hypothetical protein [Rhodoblastus sphagnicola]
MSTYIQMAAAVPPPPTAPPAAPEDMAPEVWEKVKDHPRYQPVDEVAVG